MTGHPAYPRQAEPRAAGHAWEIAERRFSPDTSARHESVFAVGNGYLGMRGAFEEGTSAHDPGVILNGFHETWPIVYPEDAYGLARTGQTIVDVPDGSIIRLFADGEPFEPAQARVLRFERVLDMRIGVLVREVEWETARGCRLLVRSRRLASLADRHLAAIEHEVVALEGEASITVCSELVTHPPVQTAGDPRRGRGFAEQVLVPRGARVHGDGALLHLATRNSGLELACGMAHRIDSPADVTVDARAEDDGARLVLQATLAAGESLRLSKFVAYHWGPEAPDRDVVGRVERTLGQAMTDGYAAIEAAHSSEVQEFWSRSDVELEGDPELQRAVRFNLFSILQATARAEGLGVPAKGVSGRGYEGHYFWDTEIYVVPFLCHTTPRWARHVLESRCAMLGAARTRAGEIGHGGAAFPWRTIDGSEASAWYAAGTAQHHINADIAYAMHQYNRVTGDLAFMLDQGAEVLVETARFWVELGFHSERRGGRFCINAVTGPDEYSAVVDNNAYTNLMARENLEIATRVIEWLQGADPAAHAELVRATGLTGREVDDWRRAAAEMHIPRHEQLGIVLQDDHFLDRKRWDLAATPADKHPLLLHYHPLELYRHQVIKQTDVVLATYLVGRHFTDDEKRRTFDYYDPLTTGDSTLSACVQSVIASEVGYPAAALEYFRDACTVDLLDAHGNTADGIHIASCGGTWLALVAGFGGLRDTDGDVCFAPRLPAEWDRLRFRVQVREQVVEVDMTHAATTYVLLEGPGLPIQHFDEPLRLTPAAPLICPAVADAAGRELRDLPRAA